jgi:hypothetical protein
LLELLIAMLQFLDGAGELANLIFQPFDTQHQIGRAGLRRRGHGRKQHSERRQRSRANNAWEFAAHKGSP